MGACRPLAPMPRRSKPGLYRGPAGTRALNAGAGKRPQLIANWPVSARLLGDAEARSLRLAGPLLTLAAVLLALDLFIALFVAGRLRRFGKGAAMACLVAGGALVAMPPPEAAAQPFQYELLPDGTYRRIDTNPKTIRLPSNGNATQKEIDAALEMRPACSASPTSCGCARRLSRPIRMASIWKPTRWSSTR